MSPLDELGVFVTRVGYHFPALEEAGAGDTAIEAVVAAEAGFADPNTADLARDILRRYLAEARAMPRAAFDISRTRADDPARLAAAFGVGVDAVLRRMASLGGDMVGLVACDSSGTLTLRKPVEGFSLPRFGAACPFWPLFLALARPGQPVSAMIEMPGRLPRRFRCRAISLPIPGQGFDAPPVYEATMLIEPASDIDEGPAIPAGSTCRTCPRDTCPARREPSMLGETQKPD